jgi:hypothetical protein
MTTLDAAAVTSHSQTLTGLTPNTLYHYRVRSSNAGSLGLSGDLTFTTAGARTCPCSLWTSSTVPATVAANDSNQVELGVKFSADISGYITGIRFYKSTQNTGTHIGTLWSSTGTQLATATFSGETASGWQQVSFSTPVAVTAGTTYVASYHTATGFYSVDSGYFASAYDNAPLHAAAGSAPNGLYVYGAVPTFPTGSFNSSNYWVDVVFATTVPAPTISAVQASAGTNSATVTWTTDLAADSQVDFGLTTAYGSQTPLDATKVSSHSVTIGTLSANTLYHYRVRSTGGGGTSVSGDFTFTTGASASCPCTLFTTQIPASAATNDANQVEVGMKFTADTDGFVTGVRFYKAATNTGLHDGHIWSAAGTLLGTATFGGETASGWQQASFTSAVPVSAGTTYVISYHTNTGNYSYDGGFFNTAFDRAPLHGLSSAASGGNGVYAYGAGATFPTSSWNATNYWVDPVFATTAPPTPAPTITNVQSSSVASTTAVISWTTDTASDSQVQYGTTTAYGSQTVLDTTKVTSHSQTLSGLAPSTLYHFRVRSSNAGGLTTSTDFTFTTAAAPPATSCPCTIFSPSSIPGTSGVNEANQVELGVKFKADVNGFITALRFYKDPRNTGTHTASLWSSTGTLLGQTTFSAETGAGWQQVSFTSPIAITAGTTYVASYHTNTGFYSFDGSAFTAGVDNAPLHALASGASGGNGVYAYSALVTFPTNSFNASNYWVDVVFTTTP